jgi:hypothetical protein
MSTANVEQLQRFIAVNNIDRTNGVLLFNGDIHFSKDGADHHINSEVQIITLPETLAIYIVEFFKEAYGQKEMYTTGQDHFTCDDNKTLQISNDDARFNITITLASQL